MTGAAEWVWANSRAANGSLIVALAIADEGGEVEMSITALAAKSRLGNRATRDAVKALERLGELSVTPRQGGISRYELSTTPADSAGLPTVDDRSTPADSAGLPRQILPGSPPATPADIAGVDIPAQNGHLPVGEPETEQPTPADIAGAVDNSSDMFVVPTGSQVAEVKDVPAKPPRRREDRPDADRLCAHLVKRITANGSRPPAITQKWRDAARLLIDKDGMTEEQVHAAIDWCQDSEFWRANILSMPKLREKYDQLRQQARRQPKRNDGDRKLGIIAGFMERAGNE